VAAAAALCFPAACGDDDDAADTVAPAATTVGEAPGEGPPHFTQGMIEEFTVR
jgi:hypothetical protein